MEQMDRRSDPKRSLLNRAKASKASTSASTPLELFQEAFTMIMANPSSGSWSRPHMPSTGSMGLGILALATAVLLMMTGIFISLAYDLGLITSAPARKAEILSIGSATNHSTIQTLHCSTMRSAAKSHREPNDQGFKSGESNLNRLTPSVAKSLLPRHRPENVDMT